MHRGVAGSQRGTGHTSRPGLAGGLVAAAPCDRYQRTGGGPAVLTDHQRTGAVTGALGLDHAADGRGGVARRLIYGWRCR